MREAMEAVYSGMSVSKASELYGIPRTTLNDHKLGKILPGARPGPQPLLSSSEERDLVQFLLTSADIGYGRTKKDVFNIVSRMLVRKGVEHSVTNGWWSKFICRHPLLASRTPATLSVSRARASTKECIDSYFNLLETTLQETGLADYPALYYNMDETGFAFDPKSNKTIHIRGEKNAFCISSGSKAQVTVIACVSAAGQAIPPLIVWKRKTMVPEMATGEIPGTVYGFSKNGWTNSIIFDSWFKKLFLRYAPASRPIILFMDGHTSHYFPDTVAFAAENGVILFLLPPNTTHLTQPLDKGVFGPFKQHWKRVCHDFKTTHPGKVICDYNFGRLFSKAWLESMTTSNIVAGFHTTGIYPVNRDAIQLPGQCDFADKCIEPIVEYTPFKRYPQNTVHTSSILKAAKSFTISRPSALRDIVDIKTPEFKTKRIKAPEEQVVTSSVFPDPPANVYGKRGGADKAIKCKYIYFFRL